MHRAFALLLLPLAAFAAPVPKEKPEARLKRLYGAFADAKKGYDFTLDDDKLVLTMGPKASESLYEKAPPRVEREVKGDFEVRVAVTLASPLEKGTEETGGAVIAGLGVWADEGRCLTVGAAINVFLNGVQCGIFRRDLTSPREKEWGLSFDQHKGRREYVGHHFRLTRKGNDFTLDDSEDGQKWQPSLTYKLTLPDTVRVGLTGQNTTGVECRATFADFSLTVPKAEEKK